ncbi:MAG: methyltransferase domain-containing protein [Deltaproteobacteria bacterium]|nr:methyltransferase domain-containing protein [Deltaproteobacteria bacterium]
MSQPPPNHEQERHWNEEAGPRWVEHREELDRQLAPFSERLIERLAPAAGERIVDVGCGCGTTSIEVAGQVGARGEVLGVDISKPMLDLARQRGAGIAELRFELADAQTYPYAQGHYDAICSRFGVMFFADPAHAFENLARALGPGGRFVFLAWQGREVNPWFARLMAAVASVIEIPKPPSPDAPGPFSLGAGERVERLLTGAGFAAPSIGDLRMPFRFGGGGRVEDVVDFMVAAGPMAKLLADAPPERAAAAREAMHAALAPFASPEGVVAPSACWLVEARKPG